MPPSGQVPIGGLSGGLYHLFNAVGLTFFTFLLGPTRAGHPSLEESCVRAGGFLALGLPAALASTLWLSADMPGVARFLIGLVGGGILGVILGSVLLSYVAKVEWEIRQEQLWQISFDEKYSELIRSKIAPAEARNLAAAYANKQTGQCFIATAAYGSSSASAVVLLRWWRDEVLLTTGHGRVFVDIYYKISPRLASLIGPYRIIRMFVRLMLGPIIIWISRIKRTRGACNPGPQPDGTAGAAPRG